MTDLEALLAAIHRDPDDDTVRLAYADELIANGQDDRAELIKVQIELARFGDFVDDAARAAAWRLTERQKKLSKQHRKEWYPTCPACRGEGAFFSEVSGKTQCPHCWRTGYLGLYQRGMMLSVPVRMEWVLRTAFHYRGATVAVNNFPTKWAAETLDRFPEIVSMPLIGFDPLHGVDGTARVVWRKMRNGAGGPSDVPGFLFDRLSRAQIKMLDQPTGHPQIAAYFSSGASADLDFDERTAWEARAVARATDDLGRAVVSHIREVAAAAVKEIPE